MSGPLTGKRILVTRALHQAGQLADALEAKGAEALRLATIAIVPPSSYATLDHAISKIESFDWVILTSANGASAFAGRIASLGVSQHRLHHLRVAAIGPATASAAHKLGLAVDVVPGEYVAETVVEMLRDKVAGKRVLLARASIGRDVIPEELMRAGAEVQVAETYQTVLPADSIERIRTLFAEGSQLPDAATFTSSSTVHNFFQLLHAAELELPRGLRAVSIGPITTRTLRERHWEPAGEAISSDISGLVEACERLFAPIV